MIGIILRKEIKNYFKSAGNWIFVFALPILLILLMSTALGDYMKTDFNTFENGKVLYYYQGNQDVSKKLQAFETMLHETTGSVMEQVTDYEEGVKAVNKSEAYGIVRINGSQIDYYRSPYNETNGGKLVHSIFLNFMKRDQISDSQTVNEITLETQPVDSTSYATFTYLAFVIMFIALMTGHSVNDERKYRTIERIKMSKAGLNALLISKILLGLLIAALQIITVWLFSTLILGIQWGKQMPFMILILFALALLSSVFGVVIGMISKTKDMADNTILMTIMLSGYIGGALSPVYLLENAGILNLIVKISPLYWAGRALNNLYVNLVDSKTWICLGVTLGLTMFFLFLYWMQTRKAKLTL